MSKQRYKRHYKDKDVFDSAEQLGNLAIKAHDRGGMPLVFVVVGIFSLIFVLIALFLKISAGWITVLIIITVGFFATAIYLFINKRKEVCPKCGKELISKNGPYGKFYACPDYPDCKFAKNINH